MDFVDRMDQNLAKYRLGMYKLTNLLTSLTYIISQFRSIFRFPVNIHGEAFCVNS